MPISTVSTSILNTLTVRLADLTSSLRTIRGVVRRVRNRVLSEAAAAVPGWTWAGYASKASAAGLDRLYIVLSFDCDTPEDALAADTAVSTLRSIGLPVTLAVPGLLLEESNGLYAQLAERGVRFMNHGYLPHAVWRDGRYWSVTWYGRMSAEEVIQDINKGHDAVCRSVGTPVGFRAPHFATFQAPGDLLLIYRTCRSLGYQYTSTTVPAFAFRHGPIFDRGGIKEVPVSGTARHPYTTLDSWSHVVSPYKVDLLPSYGTKLRATVDYLVARGIPGILNWYVDPAHIYRSDGFYSALEYALDQGVTPVALESLPALIERRRR